MKDHDYLERNPGWHSEDAVYKAAWIRAMIDKWFSADGLTIADVGCGAGDILLNLSQFYERAYCHGYEVSKTAYEICMHKANPPRLVFHHQDLLREDPGQKTYDLLLCNDVFEHIENYLAFLRSLRRYARGFIFHIPLELSAQTVIRSTGLLSYRLQYGHIHFFNCRMALQTLKECGYKIVDWRYTPSALVLPGRNIKSRLLKIPRKILWSLNPELCVRLLGGFSLLVYCR